MQHLAQNHLLTQPKKRLNPFLVRPPRPRRIILHYFAAKKAYPFFFRTFPHPLGLLRLGVDLLRIPLLDNYSRTHDGHRVGHELHHAEIVADENVS